ncbi:uncharacterized protein LOC122400322 [Colletes gigas]|uniref:uncharacterized protein LOC122400322 n=1 Tax=Colletes gigas TaxID=935657 RepID=UPI001C9B3C24|nr:uncharacterized protein LOC122400322 [Colletes gigas]
MTIKQSLPKLVSIFTAEAYAILETLKHASINNLKNVAIFSDSMSVMKALETSNSNNSHEIITKIQEAYTELDKNYNTDINIIWIPSHQGIPGNEEADAAAKEATILSPTETTVPIPYQDLINHMKKTTKEEWNRMWTTTKRTKIHDIIQNFYEPIPTCNLNRKEKSILSRLRSGHTKITHEHLIRKTDQPYCSHCPTETLTVDHILYQCRRTEPQRQKYGIKPDTALIAQAHISDTLKFLKETNMYNQI